MAIDRKRTLCLVTDPTVADLSERVERALAAGVNMLQIRGHQLSSASLYELACTLHAQCQRYNARCIMNDRLDIGQLIGADGYQLGQQSLPLPLARRLLGSQAIIGASVHSLHSATQALEQGADFLLVGTMYASASHPAETPAGPALLAAIRTAHPSSTLIAIGGITPSRVAPMLAAGADGVAVISSILHAPDIAAVVHEFRQALALERDAIAKSVSRQA